MKANELMIGDWVLTLDSTHTEQVYAQIWAIEEGQTSILVKKDNCNWFVDIDWLEPIPLTPEILEKNGFFLTYFDNEACKVWEREDFVFGEHGELAIGIQKGWQNTKIQYVHQLQHALRLCGIEKEIEL